MDIGSCTECGICFNKNYTKRATRYDDYLEQTVCKYQWNGEKEVHLFICPVCKSEVTGDEY